MNSLLDLVAEIEQDDIFDMDKIQEKYKYYPFYDDLVKYSKNKNKAVNMGVTHFDWYANIKKDEALLYLKKKYSDFIMR
jgi:hypothetical protein